MSDHYESFQSYTYSVKADYDTPPTHITIMNAERNGAVMPHEMLINTKDVANHQWLTAIASMATVCFQNGANPQLVADTLKEVFDPAGGYFSEQAHQQSMVAHIGKKIAQHLEATCGTIELESVDLDRAMGQVVNIERDVMPKKSASISR